MTVNELINLLLNKCQGSPKEVDVKVRTREGEYCNILDCEYAQPEYSNEFIIRID